jgi:hypothetical protein
MFDLAQFLHASLSLMSCSTFDASMSDSSSYATISLWDIGIVLVVQYLSLDGVPPAIR